MIVIGPLEFARESSVNVLLGNRMAFFQIVDCLFGG